MAIDWSLGRTPDIIGNALAAYDEGRKLRREDTARTSLGTLITKPNDLAAQQSLAQSDPVAMMQFQKHQAAQQQAQREQQAEQTKQLAGIIKGVKADPSKYPLARQAAISLGIPADKIPEAYDPEWVDQQDYMFKVMSDPVKLTGIAQEVQLATGLPADSPQFQEALRQRILQEGQFTLGNRRYDPTGKLVAEAPFAPRPVTVGEGQTVVEYAPGGGGSPDDIFGRMIEQESRGQQFGPDGQPLQSSAGALGIAQVMPGTAPEAAQLAGLPFDENRYRNDPQYNAALGRAYFEKQLQDFKDPALAVAAYNAGPGRVRDAVAKGGQDWQQHVPAETRDYVGKVLGPAGSRVIAQGPPKADKPRWRTLAPAESQQRGLPAGVWQESPDGELKPVSGAVGKDSTQNPEAYSASAMDAFDRAINSANRLLKHSGFSTAVGMKGVTGGLLGGWVIPGTDAADFHAELDAMKAQVFLPMVQSMKGMGALSNAEGEKLTASIGALDPKMSEAGFRASLNRIITDLNTYKRRAQQRGPQANSSGPKPTVSNW